MSEVNAAKKVKGDRLKRDVSYRKNVGATPAVAAQLNNKLKQVVSKYEQINNGTYRYI